MLYTDPAISYSRLPAHFFTRVDPTRVAAPRLIKFNHELAADLGLDLGDLDAAALAGIFSGNRSGFAAEPIAMVYAGHQFGQFVPQLGDGRAILIGEVRDRSGTRRDIQLKGSGRTPYSRSGDGRAVLGPVLREYLVSEAMHALGIPATRALAAVATGEVVYREQPLPGAILTRVAAGHVRVGTFQFFAARGDVAAITSLADYVIERHYPDAAAAANPYLELLNAVIRAQAALVAGWMNVGFIHGVMNTDNMSVSGETIDFGPCAFMDGYDSMAVFSSIDTRGRYAYAHQPKAALWNLARLAETLLPLLDPASDTAVRLANEAVAAFVPLFDACWLEGMRRKLGLVTPDPEDGDLSRGLLEVMQRSEADFTLTFRWLGEVAAGNAADAGAAAEAALVGLFAQADAIHDWLARWQRRVSRDTQSAGERAAAMRRVNPAVIPRNHRIEQAIVAAVERDDFAPFEALSEALSRPYDDRAPGDDYTQPPRMDERVLQTFCGT
jgi:uncharacterized protein YdiU (UPF0061 family)